MLKCGSIKEYFSCKIWEEDRRMVGQSTQSLEELEIDFGKVADYEFLSFLYS
jgi:hypothetical protein